MDICGALADIVNRSKLLLERLPVPSSAPRREARQEDVDRIWRQWLESCSGGDQDHFRKRLLRLGLDIDTWSGVFLPCRQPGDLPSWARVVQCILETVAAQEADQSRGTRRYGSVCRTTETFCRMVRAQITATCGAQYSMVERWCAPRYRQCPHGEPLNSVFCTDVGPGIEFGTLAA